MTSTPLFVAIHICVCFLWATTAATGQAAASFELFNADTDQKVADLVNGTFITIRVLGAPFSVKVSFSDVSIKSVKFGLDSKSSFRTETKAPFTLCGNRGSDFFPCRELGLGTHTITASPHKPCRFPFRCRTKPAGDAAVVTFTLSNCPKGYVAASNGSGLCVDMNECQNPALNKCHADADCFNTGGSYWCRCKFGYQGNGTSCRADVCNSPRATSCLDCLNGGDCGWSGTGCSSFPCRRIADVKCYDQESTQQSSNEAVCAIAARDAVDDVVCRTKTNCTSCTSTIKSDGINVCQWHYPHPQDEGKLSGFCGYGTCQFMGFCGSRTCRPGTPTKMPMAPAPVSAPIPAPSPGAAPSAPEAPVSRDQNSTSTVGPRAPRAPTMSPALDIPTKVPNANCNEKSSCKECLEAGCGGYMFRGWCLGTGQTCRSVFDMGQCYSAPDRSSVDAVCSTRDRDVADNAMCQTRTNCTSCTSTVKSGGSSTCKWYSRGVVPYCGYGGHCDWNGCGSATCPAP